MTSDLTALAAIVALLNLPFGYWRANVPTRSFQWFLAIHMPIPFVIALRLVGDVGFGWTTYPAFIGAFAVGQLLGGLLRSRMQLVPAYSPTSCLVVDVTRRLFPRQEGR
ncbi:MAG: hypothetical protein A2Z34_09365 [Planctomycetes bacterium RBG_16_59_8]|nr:MAG: hypothetical protein A2Z34_09365 [Planctomycetes bacterium RBG_16_59_8]